MVSPPECRYYRLLKKTKTVIFANGGVIKRLENLG